MKLQYNKVISQKIPYPYFNKTVKFTIKKIKKESNSIISHECSSTITRKLCKSDLTDDNIVGTMGIVT